MNFNQSSDVLSNNEHKQGDAVEGATESVKAYSDEYREIWRKRLNAIAIDVLLKPMGVHYEL